MLVNPVAATVVTVGAVMYLKAFCKVFDRPPAEVSTCTFTFPTEPAGVVTVTDVEVNEVMVAGELPKSTRTVFVKFVPVITVVVLPAVDPFVTDKLVISGGLTSWLTFCDRSTFCVLA